MIRSNDAIFQEIENYIAQIALPVEPERLYAPIRYTLLEGGKRLRPMLTMLVNQLFEGNEQKTIHAAAAIEVFHNFTLLHDDIMDRSPLRRGKETVHVKWDENVAILSGDVMTILAYRLLARSSSTQLDKILDVFNQFATQVCEGQQYDMDFETQGKVAVAEYMNMIELKTSVLIGGACHIGALLAAADEKQCALLKHFGTELGLAFQLQDDLLDTYGDEALGKPIGGDIIEGKQTFLKITAISKASDEERQILTKVHLNDALTMEEKISKVKQIYDKYNIRHITQQMINSKFEHSLSILSKLDVDEQRLKPLQDYVHTLLNRDR